MPDITLSYVAEESREAREALAAAELVGLVYSYLTWLRGQLKYADLDVDHRHALELAQGEFFRELEDRHLLWIMDCA